MSFKNDSENRRCASNVFFENDSFCKNQYGFLKGKSCMTQLLEVISDWQISLKNRKIIDCVYFDFRKAFDKVAS